MTTTLTTPDTTAQTAQTATHGTATAAETVRRSTTISGDTLPRPDFYAVDDLLTAEEIALRDRVRAFVDAEVTPIMGGYWERAEYPLHLLPKLGALRIAGGTIHGYGCPGMSAVAEGLVATELARGDGSVEVSFGVHSGLAMTTIAFCGSEEQKARWLPPLARLEKLSAFGLTEPENGSDAGHLQTRARRNGDSYILNGAKRWIGNGQMADVVVIWARDEADGKVGAYLVEKGTPGFSTQVMAGKAAMRSVANADITLTNARIPAENRLENGRDFRDTSRVLTAARYGVACSALGHAMACYEAALAYATKRNQFGKPIAGYQLIQQKLVWMLTEITAMQVLCWRLGHLLDEGRMTAEQASLAKLNNAAKARVIAADARDIMGGNGILLENLVARHQADMEAVFSYEGTDHVQTLIIGRKITGIQAFA